MLQEDLPRFGVSSDFVDITNLDSVGKALANGPKIILLESISNPLLTVADVQRVSELAHAQGAKVVVDNTLATPYHLRPLELGADVVIHSVTKYLNGHSDVTGGVVVSNQDIISKVRRTCQVWGATLDPFAAWLTVRGIKTLPLRMERSSRNAAEVARLLSGNEKVSHVYYPGLPGDSSYQVAKESLRGGFGSLVSFDLKGGLEAASKFVKSVELIRFAPSFGEPQTTLSHPAKTSHRPLSAEQRAEAGIGDGLIRLSCGIENSQDIIADIAQALNNL
jgi:methionine-gamma-lyase